MKINWFLPIMACVLVLSIASPVMAFSGAGTGTSGDPYQITNRSQWNEMDGCVASPHFKLMNDLDWFGYKYTMIASFNAYLDGNGHSLSNIYIDNSTQEDVGIFQRLETGIYNLYIINATIMSSRNANVVVGGGSEIAMGILTGSDQGNFGVFGNDIFIDKTSSVTWSGKNLNTGGQSRIGSVAGDLSYVGAYNNNEPESVVSLANVSITGIANTSADRLGGLIGTGVHSHNSVYGGFMAYLGEGIAYDMNPITPWTWAGFSNSYYDKTKNSWYTGGFRYNLSTVDMTGGDYTKFVGLSFAENTFNPDGKKLLTIGNASLSDGYPIPYVFYPYDRIRASFTPSSNTGIVPAAITFTDTTTMTAPLRPDGTAYTDRRRTDSSTKTYYWTFGDGMTSTTQNPYKLYTGSGNYSVTLTVTNAHYQNVSAVQYINVSGVGTNPLANFYATPLSGYQPHVVQFISTSTGTPTAWNWTFGDGTFSSNQYAYHTYSVAGNYSPALTVSNIYGSDTLTRYGYISVLPPATPTPTPTPTPVPTTIPPTPTPTVTGTPVPTWTPVPTSTPTPPPVVTKQIGISITSSIGIAQSMGNYPITGGYRGNNTVVLQRNTSITTMNFTKSGTLYNADKVRVYTLRAKPFIENSLNLNDYTVELWQTVTLNASGYWNGSYWYNVAGDITDWASFEGWNRRYYFEAFLYNSTSNVEDTTYEDYVSHTQIFLRPYAYFYTEPGTQDSAYTMYLSMSSLTATAYTEWSIYREWYVNGAWVRDATAVVPTRVITDLHHDEQYPDTLIFNDVPTDNGYMRYIIKAVRPSTGFFDPGSTQYLTIWDQTRGQSYVVYIAPPAVGGYVDFVNDANAVITTGELSKPIKFAGSTENMDALYIGAGISILHKDPASGVWYSYLNPGYDTIDTSTGILTVDNVHPSTPPALDLLSLSGGAPISITKSYTFTEEGSYKIQMIGYDGSNYVVMRESAILTVTKSMFNFGNVGDLLTNVFGGYGKYLIGSIIVFVCMLLPFLVVRTTDPTIAIFGGVLGVIISFALGLFDVWILFLLGLLAAAVIIFGLSGRGGGAAPATGG